MTIKQASKILSRIVPWALEENVPKAQFRSNYKGNRGRIGVIGGARDYSGAPFFASISTMRLGADLAYVICSKEAGQSIKNYSPDLIVSPLLDCPNGDTFKREMNCLLDRLHALIIGPGLGREELLQDRAKQLIIEAKLRSLPLVLDADSLVLVSEDPSIIKSYSKAILTPNRVELQRLSNRLFNEDIDLRRLSVDQIRDIVRKCSESLGVTILAKGGTDFINDSNNVDLMTDWKSGSNRRCGGQGDITAGLAAVYAFWIEEAIKNSERLTIKNPFAWAAYLAAITTRKCNEMAFKEFKNGMLASHMVDKIQSALSELLRGDSENDIDLEKSENRYAGLLNQDEIERYARQMILDEFGPEAQLRLKGTSVIIIGAGGLGCPSSAYLAGAGIGRIGIVDNDIVESSNLHRQIMHNVERVGMHKTESIKQSIQAINPNVAVDVHTTRFTRENAVELVEKYDIVIDATDNLTTRYIISDACVVARKPLVSGAALRTDGQLTVYNYDEDTPCFRCLFPIPPKAVGSCSENGVLGVLPGIIGVHQALETIKIASGLKPSFSGHMLLLDGMAARYKTVKLAPRRKDCASCGEDSKLDRKLIDYDIFCPADTCENPTRGQDILTPEERISVTDYDIILKANEPHVLVDVRPKSQSDVSRFKHALQIPIIDLINESERSKTLILKEMKAQDTFHIYVICRRGFASQRGTKIIKDIFKDHGDRVQVKDIIGGMTSWSKSIDSSFSCV